MEPWLSASERPGAPAAANLETEAGGVQLSCAEARPASASKASTSKHSSRTPMHVKRVGGQQFEPTSGAAQVGNASNPQRQTPTERPPGEAPRECVLWEDVLETLEGRATVTNAESCSNTEESLESARCMKLVDDRVDAEAFQRHEKELTDTASMTAALDFVAGL